MKTDQDLIFEAYAQFNKTPSENEESNIKFSVGSVGGQHSQIMHTDKTFDSLEDACNHAGVDVQDCISGEWDDMGDGTKEYGVDEDTVIIMHVGKTPSENEESSEGAVNLLEQLKQEMPELEDKINQILEQVFDAVDILKQESYVDDPQLRKAHESLIQGDF